MTLCENNSKKCGKCSVEKPLQDFYYDSHHKKPTSRCKQCIKEYNAAYQKKNPELSRLSRNEWHKRNRGKVIANNAKRKASKRQRTPSWLSKDDYRAIRTEYELAAWCSDVMGVPYHVDHIVPLQGKTVCGLHVPWNLQVIPASVNLSKYNSFP